MADVCKSETPLVNDSHPPRPESNRDDVDSDPDYKYEISESDDSEQDSEPEEEYKWSHIKFVYEDGKLGEKPAAAFLIYLKASAPEGCDKERYHMGILEKVVNGSLINDIVFKAVLTKDEHAKLCVRLAQACKFENQIPESDDSEPEEEYKWSHIRYVYEDGKLGEKPAAAFLIYLKASGPEGCDKETYHMGILEKVVNGSATAAFIFSSLINDIVFKAVLTKDEHAKLCALDEVAETIHFYG